MKQSIIQQSHSQIFQVRHNIHVYSIHLFHFIIQEKIWANHKSLTGVCVNVFSQTNENWNEETLSLLSGNQHDPTNEAITRLSYWADGHQSLVSSGQWPESFSLIKNRLFLSFSTNISEKCFAFQQLQHHTWDKHHTSSRTRRGD